MSEVILTIAIPTYNRLSSIKKQVDLLLPQLNEFVNLIVYDNCSEPKVESLFNEAELAKFKLIQNIVNVGADANIARCFENCSTKWLWTLSDDDFVATDSVSYLLKILENDIDTVFFNFQNGLSFETIGFESFSLEFKDPKVFSSSFTMSSCVYNMSVLRSSLIDYYSNLSSMVGTIILVLKYVQRNPYAKCRFIDHSLINEYNKEVGWDYRTFVLKSILFVYSFKDSVDSRNFNSTLFLGYFLTNYWLIANNRNYKQVSKKERLAFLWINIKNQGILNALRYCPKTILRTVREICFK